MRVKACAYPADRGLSSVRIAQAKAAYFLFPRGVYAPWEQKIAASGRRMSRSGIGGPSCASANLLAMFFDLCHTVASADAYRSGSQVMAKDDSVGRPYVGIWDGIDESE